VSFVSVPFSQTNESINKPGENETCILVLKKNKPNARQFTLREANLLQEAGKSINEQKNLSYSNRIISLPYGSSIEC
jgi:hypothetical protein